MGFSDRQMRALARSVPARNVKTRVSSGKELTYIEGWYALAQANRIFGFDGWDRETIETKCLQQRESRGHCTAVYSARVRITVRAGDMVIVRDGHGTGEAHGDSGGEVHDRALKAAETDATKRALATFGKAFGLALYSGAGRVSSSNGKRPSPTVLQPNAPAAEARVPSEGLPGLISADSNGEAGRHAANGGVKAELFEETEGPRGRGTGAVPAESIPVTNADRSCQRTQMNGSAGHPAIDKSALALSEPRRVRDKEHLRFVASQPCLLCSALPSDAHHLRFSQPRALGRKVGDDFTVPLCRQHHRDLHDSGNEAAWWHDMGIDALEIAKQLWRETERRESAARN